MACCTRTTNATRGITLIESMIASVVLAIAVVGIAGGLNAASAQRLAMNEDGALQLLASSLLEEIVGKPFSGPSSGNQPGYGGGSSDRSCYDEIADYSGYSETRATTINGQTIDLGDGATYLRGVTIEYRSTPSGANTSNGEFAMITVTVKSSITGRSFALSRLVGNTTLNPR